MPDQNTDTFRQWYTARRLQYEQLSEAVADILRRLLQRSQIQVLDISHRAKEIDSAVEKMSRKAYQQPRKEMTDLAGVRVITFIETDVRRVASLVAKSFALEAENTSDRSDSLGVDRAGYRSIHCVCTLGDNRSELPELSTFRDLRFEIQIRTALQHAWAEIEHNRHYKFAGTLPATLERRLFLLAGMLEIADRELAAIVGGVDAYAASIGQSTQHGNLNISLTPTTVLAYVKEKAKRLSKTEVMLEQLAPEAIEELEQFGVANLAQLDVLFSLDFLSAVDDAPGHTTALGLLRDAMLYDDLNGYFLRTWRGSWHQIHPKSVALLVARYGSAYAQQIVQEYGLRSMWRVWP
jgi:ppGpp synthetase/RelA/SpoT-type nucleotidyltranferase